MTLEIVSCRLDLAVRLQNAVTGDPVAGSRPMFQKDGKNFKLKPAGGADWIGVNIGREDFVLGVNVRGFEKTVVPIRYELLDPRLPIVEIPLIPEQTEWDKPSYMTLEGSLDKIEELQAVPLKGGDLYAVSYQKEERTISLYNPHKKMIRLSSYAIVDQKKQEFEIITVLKALPDGKYQLKEDLKKGFEGRSPVVSPVYGMVSQDGSYLIRIPRNRADTEWILRLVAGGKEHFQTADLLEPVSLTERRSKQSGKKG